jgi:hypothetical protein
MRRTWPQPPAAARAGGQAAPTPPPAIPIPGPRYVVTFSQPPST